jgi:hypothetical protein
MTARASVFALVGFLTFGAASAQAFEATAIIDDLDRAWTGQFQWNGDDEVQYVSVNLDAPYSGEDGQVFATGEAEYVLGSDVTVVGVEWQIDPVNSTIEIREIPSKHVDLAAFEADGSYVGRLTADMQSIKAVWTTNSTGEQGSLVLEAVGF